MHPKYIPCTCDNCGKAIRRKPSEFHKAQRHYCCRRCFDEHRPARTVDRFWSKVDKRGACWLWTGLTRGYGYGKYDVRGRAVVAHRYAYELTHGPIPAGMLVRHSCDNPRCVNPDHLLLGSTTDNIADKVARGRAQHGEQCYNARLTDDAVRRMRELYDAGVHGTPTLGRMFGISTANAWLIVKRRAWRHVL